MDETAITRAFADGDYTFFLPLIRCTAFKREAGCSIYELFYWLGEHLGRIDGTEVLTGPSPADPEQSIHLIRNALIGGGVEPTQAKALVDQYCFPARRSIYDMGLAWAILRAAIYGVEVGSKKKDETPTPTRSKKAG